MWAGIKLDFKVSTAEGLHLTGMIVSTWLVDRTLSLHFCLYPSSPPSRPRATGRTIYSWLRRVAEYSGKSDMTLSTSSSNGGREMV